MDAPAGSVYINVAGGGEAAGNDMGAEHKASSNAIEVRLVKNACAVVRAGLRVSEQLFFILTSDGFMVEFLQFYKTPRSLICL